MKDIARMKRIKFYQRTCLHSARNGHFFLGDKTFYPRRQNDVGLWCDEILFIEVYPESRDITGLQVTKIEGSCSSRFFMIFQELPTES